MSFIHRCDSCEELIHKRNGKWISPETLWDAQGYGVKQVKKRCHHHPSDDNPFATAYIKSTLELVVFDDPQSVFDSDWVMNRILQENDDHIIDIQAQVQVCNRGLDVLNVDEIALGQKVIFPNG